MRGANKNLYLKGYAEWSHRAPYIGISCVVGGIESDLATGRPIGDSRHFKKKGDTSTFLKWSLGSLSNFTGTKGIRAAVAHQLRAAAAQNNKSWSHNDTTRINLRMSDGNAATILDFARPELWDGLKLESSGVIWDKSVVLSLPGRKQVVVAVEKVTINVTWSDRDLEDGDDGKENDEAKRVPKRRANGDMTRARQGGKKDEAKAAAANTKKKAVEKRKKSHEEIMPSDSDEDESVPQKAPRKEDKRLPLEEQQQRRKAERSAVPEEECIGVAPAVVAAQSDEANERSSAQAEESYWTDPAFWASVDAMVADHESHYRT